MKPTVRTLRSPKGGTRRDRLPRRRGVTALLAMLFVVLFSTLAVGFFATVTTNTQLAGNEQRGGRATLAAESGMQFMRYHLATLDLPPKTPPAELFDKVYASLSAKLDNFANMPPGGRTISLSADETQITIPGGSDQWIKADEDGSAFRAVVTKVKDEEIEVRVYGRFGAAASAAPGNARAVKLNYANFPNPAKIFNYGVASRSPISMNGNVTIRGTTGNEAMGSVLSAHETTNVPLTMTGGPKISGHVSFTNPNAQPSISSQATIAGLHTYDAGFDKVVHKDADPPEFPLIDTSGFEQYVPPITATTGTSVIKESSPSGTYFKNIRIKAGVNPTFSKDTTIQGVVWVESPNEVKFAGGANIQGVIVVATDGANNELLDTTENTLEFTGGVTFTGVQTLPATSDFPLSLRQKTGATILAPGFGLKFSGNFNTIGGTIVASQMTFGGTSGGIVKGSVINLKDTALSLGGTADIIIESQGTANYPAGVLFGSSFSPLPYTYEEVRR